MHLTLQREYENTVQASITTLDPSHDCLMPATFSTTMAERADGRDVYLDFLSERDEDGLRSRRWWIAT